MGTASHGRDTSERIESCMPHARGAPFSGVACSRHDLVRDTMARHGLEHEKIFVVRAASGANVVRAQSPPRLPLEIFFSLYRYGENLYLTIARLLLINYYLAWTLP
jgi:hypothetical protein